MSKEDASLVLELVGLMKEMILQQGKTNATLEEMARRQKETNARLDALAADVKALTGWVDALGPDLKSALERHAQHEARITKLEAAVFKPAEARRTTRAAKR